jgi:hypothetical protein
LFDPLTLKIREHLQGFAKSIWHPSIFGKTEKKYAPTV